MGNSGWPDPKGGGVNSWRDRGQVNDSSTKDAGITRELQRQLNRHRFTALALSLENWGEDSEVRLEVSSQKSGSWTELEPAGHGGFGEVKTTEAREWRSAAANAKMGQDMDKRSRDVGQNRVAPWVKNVVLSFCRAGGCRAVGNLQKVRSIEGPSTKSRSRQRSQWQIR